MNRGHRSPQSAATTLLCVGLVLHLHVWTAGCGGLGAPALLPGRTHRLALTPDHELAQALAGTPFEKASAIEIDPAGRFGLILPDGRSRLEGTFASIGGRFAVSGLTLAVGALRLDLTLDAEKHLTALDSAAGQHWRRPTGWIGEPVAPDATALDATLAANAELLAFARRQHAAAGNGPSAPGAGTTPPDPAGPKADPSAQAVGGDLAAILDTLSALLAVQAVVANFPAVVWVFEVVVAVQLTMTVAGITPQAAPAAAPTDTPSQTATLQVSNDLTDGRPVWSVRLMGEDGTPGADMLDGQAIPAGASRAFVVPVGVRDVSVRVPSGKTCFVEYVRKGRQFVAGGVDEVVITDEDEGTLTPDGCDNG